MIQERNTSAGINIGIGLMLESIFDVKDRYDKDREIKKIDLDRYDYHMYNMVTVLRDVKNSINGKYRESDLINMVIDDMNVVNDYYDSTECTPVLYIPDYVNILKDMNKDKVYKTTKKDTEIMELINIIKYVSKIKLKGLNMQVMRFNKNPYIKGDILLTTSFLIDMELMGVCDLLETHTGVLKNKNKLYTKFATIGKRDLSHIPYNKTTHRILGDKTLVKPADIKTRVAFYDLSIEKKWNAQTNESKINNDIKKILN